MAENVITLKFYLCKRKVNLIKVAAMKMGICFIQFHNKVSYHSVKTRSSIHGKKSKDTEKFLKT